MSVCSSDDDSDSDFGSETGYDETLAAINYEADLAIEKNIDPADDVGIMVNLARKQSIIRTNLHRIIGFLSVLVLVQISLPTNQQ